MTLNFLARLFLEAPSNDLMLQIKNARVFEQWPVPSQGKEDAAALDLLTKYFRDYDESCLKELNSEYTELFIGPANAIPLWESVWTTKEHLLFDGPMFDVRERYAKYGLASPNPEHEPDDHIGLEMSFLGGVMGCATDALFHGDDKAAQEHAATAADFLKVHLSLWASRFLHTVADRADSSPYGAIARLSEATIARAENVLQETSA